MSKQKLLIFHPFIASYRVDLYNNLSKIFDLKVVCWYENIDGSLLGFDIKKVNKLANFNYEYLKGSYFIKNRVINFSFGKAIRHFRPDIVLPHEFGLNTIITVLLRKHLKYKIFVTSDDSPTMAEACTGIRSRLRNFIIERIDGLIIVNPEVAEILKKKYKSSNCRYLFFPIIQDDEVLKNKFSDANDISKRKIEEFKLADKKIILFVGRLVKEKGVDLLIMSFETVLKKEPNAILVIVGGGTEETRLRNLIEKLQLTESVFLKGKLHTNELYAWYNLASIFVLPSRFEPFGAVVNEALVAGCFTIVSDKVGAKCLIDSGNGTIFESENFESLSQLIVNRLNSTTTIPGNAIKFNLMNKGLHAFTDDLIDFISNKQFISDIESQNTIKPKAVIFYTYLPPWRIDIFNEMGQYYDLTIIFLNPNLEGFKYNKELLLKSLKVPCQFLDNGFTIGSRPFRFGIYRILKNIQPDVVFSHEYSPTSLLISFFLGLKIFHFKYIITTSDNLSMVKRVIGLKFLVRQIVLTSADGIVVYTSRVSDWYKKHFKKLKVEVCPNIQSSQTLLSNIERFDTNGSNYQNKFQLKDSNIILYVGRLASEKGLKYLIKAFAESDHSDYKLVLVGEGNQKKYLIDLAKRLHISEKVIFPGQFDGANLYVWYSLANFFVLPSIFEPFGAVVNEALVFGCPVLASKYIGALDFIKPDYNGFIFDPLNQSEFISTLNKAMITYKSFNLEKKDLMIQSFEEYVKVYKFI